jgi:hypothetical protein
MPSSLLVPACCLGAGSEAEAVVSGLEDVATVGQAIEERGGHLGVAEDRGPSLKLRLVVTATLGNRSNIAQAGALVHSDSNDRRSFAHQDAIAFGEVATIFSPTVRPSSSTTHIAVCSSETSSAA